ncbi:MAG TPA: sigma-54 dependent transcriptional regulator [Myxococcales bacterium]|nr:sigma-54 dependent transcriptional regulator [Myxococcales bacterium]
MTTPALRLLVVDDDASVWESLKGSLLQDGFMVETAPDGRTALARLREQEFAVLLLDLKTSGTAGLQILEDARKLRPECAVVAMAARAEAERAVSALERGAWDYLLKPFDPGEPSLRIRRIVAHQRLAHDNEVLRKTLERSYRLQDLVSRAPAMQKIFELARVAAPSPATVLIVGESGTGKEALARAIHEESPRRACPFLAVSCAGLSEALLESELFGDPPGAARRKGKIEAAHGGTLFLDELGEISSRLQLHLLRVLEERKLPGAGGSEAVPVDVRIVAAASRELAGVVAEGRFREDLFSRLNAVVLRLPPLRERKEDIPLLVDRFVERLSAELGRPLQGVSQPALAALMAQSWPGNVGELRKLVERGAVVAQGPVLQLADLGLEPRAATTATGEPVSLEELEKRHIVEVLSFARNNVTHSARILGIDRVTLYNKIKRYRLPHR